MSDDSRLDQKFLTGQRPVRRTQGPGQPAHTLKKLMDRDLITGYAVQTLISRIYFRRYLETMNKLQAVVQSIPLT